jgi:hypothetical protein
VPEAIPVLSVACQAFVGTKSADALRAKEWMLDGGGKLID